MTQSFDRVKSYLASTPIVGLFQKDHGIVITTDTSDVRLGAMMSQIRPNGEEIKVGCISHSLQPRERRYCTMENEGLTFDWACSRWRWYLWGSKFIIRTDH